MDIPTFYSNGDPKEMLENAQDTGTNLKGKVSETANKAKNKAEEVGRKIQEKIDETREPAAAKLHSAASTLHEKAQGLPGGETVAGAAHSAADKMQATADYMRGHDIQNMMADVGAFVRRHPGPLFLAAIAAGFLIGRTFRNKDWVDRGGLISKFLEYM